ncbi:MAG TPA: ROK family protein [Pirellulaceae bacterium]|nr:ROK family protein [Pirellulaceae bacterium]
MGFDLGGTKMLAVAYDHHFKPLGRKRRRTKGNEGPKAGLDRIVQTIQDALADAKLTPDQLSGIGVGCPGTVDLDTGIILEAANLGWKNVRLKEHLEKTFNCPAVIANDVDSGVYGEYRFGAAQNARCVIGVFPGTGIGGGCIYEGRILRGKKHSCMEIGHVEAVTNGNLCGCGRRGCLETEASRLAIATQVASAAYRGDAPYIQTNFGTDLSEIRSSSLADAIKAGDTAVETIIRRACGFIGTAVANVVNLLAPEMVVLGGGLVEAMPELFVDAVGNTARDRAMPSMAKSFKVVAAKLGDDAGVLGAAAWVERQVSPREVSMN